MASLVLTPAHSAALIMEELREGFPLAGSRASAVASMEVEVSTEAEAFMEAAVTGNSVQFHENRLMIWRTNSCTQKI